MTLPILDKRFVKTFLTETIDIINKIDHNQVVKVINILADVQESKGRLFILGVGGGAAHASHAVADFRKVCNIQAYTPTDNVSEITARTNDEGWYTTFVEYLKINDLTANDCVLIISVGGGNVERKVSPNLIYAINYAKIRNVKVIGIVGRDGGVTAQRADACIIIPEVNKDTVTPQTESLQSLICHLIVSSPALKVNITKW